jgi:hypothetical protein
VLGGGGDFERGGGIDLGGWADLQVAEALGKGEELLDLSSGLVRLERDEPGQVAFLGVERVEAGQAV